MFKIKSSDEFEFQGAVRSYDKDGKEKLAVNYKKNYDNKLVVTIEGMEDGELRVKKSVKYGAFKRRYPRHSVYLQGRIDLGE